MSAGVKHKTNSFNDRVLSFSLSVDHACQRTAFKRLHYP